MSSCPEKEDFVTSIKKIQTDFESIYELFKPWPTMVAKAFIPGILGLTIMGKKYRSDPDTNQTALNEWGEAKYFLLAPVIALTALAVINGFYAGCTLLPLLAATDFITTHAMVNKAKRDIASK